ncbi:flavo protein [Gloeophyllum trabeum ATCC 11539]|uniref:Flavo protein n=1 Tax=Gloeophyllum trabeum (strain ATCC 11539 / FP-39264 / Madison 617) TaxID=670483 RepID=S7RMA1_GLOTA|nr:flavo protein [Gloeophyllum trabeum ATCC 11539]EPQ55535.1 flavo protein [Gloeophyllum trabeum ATCC 11539]
MSTQSKRIGIILGSSRKGGNAAGLAKWVTANLQKNIPEDVEVVTVDPVTPPHPLGPLVDPIMPSLVKDQAEYPTQHIRDWSAFVSSCGAIVVITPQFNWGYPGELKNALDHLYYEWHGKPAMMVTYGSRGGGKCAEQLRQVMGKGLKMKLTGRDVLVSLPHEYIAGQERTTGDDEFLKAFEESLKEASDELYELMGGEANAPA